MSVAGVAGLGREVTRALFAAAVALAVSSVVACGGGAAMAPSPSSSPALPSSPASSPPPPPRGEPSTVDDAKAEIARARAVLEPTAGGQGGQQPNQPDQAPLTSGASQCQDACRALASMRRAVDALCRLAGDADDQCIEGRATLARCETRVASCGC